MWYRDGSVFGDEYDIIVRELRDMDIYAEVGGMSNLSPKVMRTKTSTSSWDKISKKKILKIMLL